MFIGNLIDGAAGLLGIDRLKLYIFLGVLIIMAVMAGGIWFLWNRNQELNKDLGAANLTIQTMAEVIEQKEHDIEDIRVANASLEKTRQKNREAIENLEIKLNALKLGYSAVKNAPDTQKVVNNFLAQQKRCVEITSGAAVVAGETNEVCPNLVKVAP